MFVSTICFQLGCSLSGTPVLNLQLGAAASGPDEPSLSVDDLADQIAEILDYFG